VTSDELNTQFNSKEFVGPGLGKVLGICGALKSPLISPIIVSGYIPWAKGHPLSWAVHIRTRGVCYAKLLSFSHAAGKRATSALSFLVYAVRHIRRTDRVILYNFFPEYLLAAIFLWAVRNPAVMDIEDAPRSDEKGLRGLSNRVCFALLKPLCRPQCITVSKVISTRLGFVDSLPIYGVASSGLEAIQRVPNHSALRILFGGEISRGTGLNLFIEAVGLLADQYPRLAIHFFVTGRYPAETLAELKRQTEDRSHLTITLLGELPGQQYRALLDSIDIGLCLKLPSHSLGQTTFPSKVIEFASAGVLVCSTRVSDVPLLFDSTSALLLESEDPVLLADAIVHASANRSMVTHTALRGASSIRHLCSADSVRRDMVRFLFA